MPFTSYSSPVFPSQVLFTLTTPRLTYRNSPRKFVFVDLAIAVDVSFEEEAFQLGLVDVGEPQVLEGFLI